jgi:hypothetical protein
VFFCGQKDSKPKIFINKCLLFIVESACRVKRFTAWSRNFHLGGKCFADDEQVETEMRKWLRKQSKDFYAAGFDAVAKRWDMCINVDGGYVKK